MITLALVATLLGQCQPGGICRPAAVQTPCIATTAFPTCNASLKGRSQCNSTLSCDYYCNGTAWACGTGSGSSSTSPWYYDGGSIGNVPQGAQVQAGASGYVTDGGYWVNGGPAGYGSASVPSIGWGGPSAPVGFFFDGANFIWSNTGLRSPTYIFSGIYLATDGYVSASSYVSAGGDITTATYLRSVGVATGSLPTCNAGQKGAIETDTTKSRAMFCDGAKYYNPVNHISGYMHGQGLVVPANAWTIANTRMYSAANWQRLSWAVLLLGAGAAQTFTVDVYNNTTSTVLCTSSALACDGSPIGSIDCANVASAEFDDIRLRVNAANCSTIPTVNVTAESM